MAKKEKGCCDVKVEKTKDGLQIIVKGAEIEKCLEFCLKKCCGADCGK